MSEHKRNLHAGEADALLRAMLDSTEATGEEFDIVFEYLRKAIEVDVAEHKMIRFIESNGIDLLRKKYIKSTKIDWSSLQVGDKVPLDLSDIGKFTCTVHKVTEKGILLITDECVAMCRRYEIQTWASHTVRRALPKDFYDKVTHITVPTLEEIGYKDDTAYSIDGYEETLKLMSDLKNRVSTYHGYPTSYWLRNVDKYNSSKYRIVFSDGTLGNSIDNEVHGVRLEIALHK